MGEIQRILSLKNSANLKAYYRFNTGALTTDSSLNAVTLTNANGVADGVGKFGGGADFGATNTNKRLYTSNTLGIDGGACSFSMRVKMRTEIGSGFMTFMTLRNNSTKTFYEIYYDYNGGTRRIFFDRGKPGVGDQQVSVNHAVGTSDFAHLGLTYNGTTLVGYLNGVSIGSIAASGNGSSVVTNGLAIGADVNGNNRCTSIHDDVAVFDTALTAAQMLTIYEKGNTGAFFQFT